MGQTVPRLEAKRGFLFYRGSRDTCNHTCAILDAASQCSRALKGLECPADSEPSYKPGILPHSGLNASPNQLLTQECAQQDRGKTGTESLGATPKLVLSVSSYARERIEANTVKPLSADAGVLSFLRRQELAVPPGSCSSAVIRSRIWCFGSTTVNVALTGQ